MSNDDCFTGVPRSLSLLPQTVPHFVNREAECEEVGRYLCPTHDCRCVLLHGAPGIGKTALAIKVVNEILDDRTVVVYVNCRFIDSFEDFAGKVVQQIYHYPLNDPVSGMAKRLNNSNFYTILLLDNFEFLLHLNSERENPLGAENVYGRMNREPSEGTKVEDFIAEIVTSSRKVKLLVTSSEDVAFPGTGKQRVKLAPFNAEASFQLLTKVCEGRPVRKACADQLTDICSGIPLVLYTLMSSQDDLVSCVQQMSCSPPGEKFAYLQKIQTVPKREKIIVCLDVCFDRLCDKEKDTLIRLALFRGWFTSTGAAKVFNSAALREHELIGHVIELANRSLLERNIIGGDCFYTFLSVIRDYCKRKASSPRFCDVFHKARDLFIDHFFAFLKDTFKAFLSKNAARAIADFLREEENIMQLLEWMDNGEMDDERMKTCIDVFNMVGELLAKMMGKVKFKSVYELLRKKCQDIGDHKRLSECLTSLGIKEVFNCSCSPGLCDGASERAKTYLVEADGLQTALGINSGNSRAQCLAKLGRCLAKEHDSRERGNAKIKEAIRIRLNAHGDENGGEDICKVMLGATYNDMAGEFISPRVTFTVLLLYLSLKRHFKGTARK